MHQIDQYLDYSIWSPIYTPHMHDLAVIHIASRDQPRAIYICLQRFKGLAVM
jgi:hypothetical protein